MNYDINISILFQSQNTSQNTSRKGSSTFHSNYTLSRADAPDIVIERYNPDECQIHNTDEYHIHNMEECSQRYNEEECQRYNLDELDNIMGLRHDSVSSRDASTSTHDKDSLNNTVPKMKGMKDSSLQTMVAKETMTPAMVAMEALNAATPSCSYHHHSNTTTSNNRKSVTAADLVNGLIDTNGDVMYIDADSNEYVDNSSKLNDNETLYYESTV